MIGLLALKSYGQDYITYSGKLKEKRSLSEENVRKKVKDLEKAYKSFEIKQKYPGAKNPKLLKEYFVMVKKNEKLSKKDLVNLDVFETIEKDELGYALCSDPVGVNDPFLNGANVIQKWHLSAINAYCAWEITKGKPEIEVGIADSEFDITHEDMEGKYSYLEGPTVTDPYYHGLRVSGFAGAKTNNAKGIASIGYNSSVAAQRILHTKIEKDNGTFTATASSASIASSVWDLYTKASGRPPVINVSWTTTGLTTSAAEEITEGGTVLVCSAGNTEDSRSHYYINDIPGVIVVTSIDQNMEHGPTGHAHNEFLDLCAPGAHVGRVYENNSYSNGWGTSYAAPIVAGTVALMVSVNPCLSPSEIEDIIKSTTDPVADAADFPGEVGTGRLNAYEAVLEAVNVGTGYVNSKYNTSKTFTAPSKIASSGKMLPGANVVFKASHEVELLPGFEVQSGAAFEVDMNYVCQSGILK